MPQPDWPPSTPKPTSSAPTSSTVVAARRPHLVEEEPELPPARAERDGVDEPHPGEGTGQGGAPPVPVNVRPHMIEDVVTPTGPYRLAPDVPQRHLGRRRSPTARRPPPGSAPTAGSSSARPTEAGIDARPVHARARRRHRRSSTRDSRATRCSGRPFAGSSATGRCGSRPSPTRRSRAMCGQLIEARRAVIDRARDPARGSAPPSRPARGSAALSPADLRARRPRDLARDDARAARAVARPRAAARATRRRSSCSASVASAGSAPGRSG